MDKKCSGFTLIELAAVLAIVAVLATLSVSNLIACRPRYELGEAVTDILSLLQNARLRAVKENRRVVVLFDPDGNGRLEGDYMAFVDNGTGGAGEWTRQSEDDEPLVAGGKVPGGVRLLRTSFNHHRLRFDSRGHLMDINRSVTLMNTDGLTRKITVYASGNCRVN
ncbi:MAG: GspH/FimT family pseudopilin [Deltaproteobacteria bacterium]|nr:GspH/FimT family pseudopilin [Deltaproteobacteria bacterium]